MSRMQYFQRGPYFLGHEDAVGHTSHQRPIPSGQCVMCRYAACYPMPSNNASAYMKRVAKLHKDLEMSYYKKGGHQVKRTVSRGPSQLKRKQQKTNILCPCFHRKRKRKPIVDPFKDVEAINLNYSPENNGWRRWDLAKDRTDIDVSQIAQEVQDYSASLLGSKKKFGPPLP